MDEREKNSLMNKRLEVTTLPEFASLFNEPKYTLVSMKLIFKINQNGKIND